MDKREVLRVLGRYAFANELLDRPQARAWARAAQVLRGVDGDFSELYHAGELAELRGVGKGTLAVIGEVLAGQTPASLAELEALVPDGLFAIAGIRGLGPKKVKALWTELGVTTVGELEYACQENRLVDLAGFGPKTQDKVLAEIARLRTYEGLYRRDLAQSVAAAALERCVDGEVAGGLAAGAELVEAVVLVATSVDWPEAEPAPGGWRAEVDGVPVRVRVAVPADRGVALVEETASAGHLASLRARAQARGVALSGATEAEVYRRLELVPTARERRLDGVPLVEVGKPAPELVRFEDLKGALHNHTTASDGAATLDQMCQAARALGLGWMGVSEHSAAAAYAGGLDATALGAQVAAIRGGAHAVEVLAGVESDILEDGSLDYDDATLAALDYVVASVHQRFRQDPDAMTERVLRAVRHPYTDVIGHPTGRLLLGRAENGLDVARLVEVAAEVGCAVELNASPHRLDLGVAGLGLAREAGVLVSIVADAHSTRALANLHHGIAVARRAGLRPEDVLNSRDASAVRRWVVDRRALRQ